jgi:two-component system sensor histidine kinase CiaH
VSARPVSDAALVRRVRWRLLAWSGGSTLAVLVLLGSLIYVAVANSLSSAAIDQLRDRARLLEPRVEILTAAPPGLPPGPAFNTIVAADPGQAGVSFVGGSAAGTFAFVVGPTDAAFPDVRRLFDAQLPNETSVEEARATGESIELANVEGTPVRILSRLVTVAGEPFVIQVVADRIAEERALAVLLAVLLLGGVVVLAVSLGVGWLYAERALVPIRDALRRQRDFAADASHELRTPLSVVKGSVAHLRRHADQPVAEVGDALDDIEAETDRLGALVNDLLLLARTDSDALDLAVERTDLGEVALDAAGSLAPLASERNIRIEVDTEPLPLTGDPGRLRQLVRILVDNAIRHAPQGTVVNVSAHGDHSTMHLRVEDAGAGFRTEDLPRVFDRFWRAPGEHATGTGLGLAIAAWIVERHGGAIEASNRPGGGARLEVRLPAS